uniref:Uncharacterized protein n=1 Tax=Rhodnius prolixus TaxID=13249 RepID=T1IDD7_RHOPR
MTIIVVDTASLYTGNYCDQVKFLNIFLVCFVADAGQIVIVILSQDNGYHSQIANRLKENITEQASAIQSTPMIYIVPNDLNYIGAWTVIPILP